MAVGAIVVARVAQLELKRKEILRRSVRRDRGSRAPAPALVRGVDS